MKKFLKLLFTITLIAGCSNPPPEAKSDSEEAHAALINFFELLNNKRYAEAVPVYGGSYELMQTWNPDMDPTDHASLWQKACEQNGLQCLEVRTATLSGQEGSTFIFQVEFSNPDGTLFVRGPCCGASETEMPPQSQFEYSVTKSADGKFLVMDMPPYVP